MTVAWRMASVWLLATSVIFLGACLGPRGLSEVDHNVVRVLASDANDADQFFAGSGFVIAPGFVVTNHHVIAEGDRVFVVAGGPTGNKVQRGRVFWSSADHDLAILEVPELSRRGLRLNLADLSRAKGEQVLAIGFPGIADEIVVMLFGDSGFNDERLARALGESTVSSGVVGRVIHRPWLGGTIDLKMIQHDASLHQGNSGGPLLNACGQVIGVNTERAVPLIDEESGVIRPGEGVSFAAHASELASVLAMLDLPHRTTSRTCRSLEGALAALGLLLLVMLLLGLWFRAFMRGRAAASVRDGVPARPYAATDRMGKFLKGQDYTQSPEAPDPASLSEWMAEWHSGGGQGTVRPDRARLESSEGCVLGRSDAVSDLVVEQGTVSRRHCVLRRVGEQLEVMDLNSSNGTVVSGVRLKPFTWYPVTENQPWQMGDVTLTVHRRQAD